MPKPTQQELENLIKLFLAARDQLIDTIINYRGIGTKVYANTILQQLQRQLKRLERQSAYYVESVIPAEYQKALDEVYAYFTRNNLLMSPPAAFAQLHGDMIYMVAREMQYQIGQGLEQAGRQIIRYVDDARDDTLRMAGLEATGEKIASGATVRQMQQNLVNKLQSQGFMTVQYGSGNRAYQVSLDTYAAMVARSTTREAGNLARVTQLSTNGYDLVKMTSHYPTCEICAPLQGRVYSISGNDKRFPPLSRAFRSGYYNVHPNCRHSVHPYIESMQNDEELAADIERSNQPFDDTRPEAERALYNKQQAQNRQMRQDRYQYERYKARLGEDAPKTFSVFRMLKKANSENWRIAQLDYKRRCRLVDHPELSLPSADKATAADAKFEKYLFSAENPDGNAKGVAFESRLGYNKNNWKELQAQIVNRAKLYPAMYSRDAPTGVKLYQQNQVVYGTKNKPANVKVIWGVNDIETRLVTCMIEEVK